MQNQESDTGMGSGERLDDELDDSQVIDVDDDINADVADVFDELAVKNGEDPISEHKEEPEVDNVDDDVTAASKEIEDRKLEKKEPEATRSEQKPAEAKQDDDDDIKAPARFTAAEKEIFDKMPKKLKATAKKAFDDMQADYTRAKQFLAQSAREIEEAKKENETLTSTIKRYIGKWGAQGLTPEQAIVGLASVQDRLTNPNKEERKAAYAELLLSSGLEPADFAEILGGEVVPQQSQPQQNYQPAPLTEVEKERQSYLDALMAREAEAQRQQAAKQVEQAKAEIDQVIYAKDQQTGAYLYPKLHDAGYIEQVRPLVLTIMRTTGVSWGEAFKRAYISMNPDSLQSVTRPTSAINRNSGRIVKNSPTIRSSGQPQNLPEWGQENDDGSVEDDVTAAYEKLMREGSGQY